MRATDLAVPQEVAKFVSSSIRRLTVLSSIESFVSRDELSSGTDINTFPTVPVSCTCQLRPRILVFAGAPEVLNVVPHPLFDQVRKFPSPRLVLPASVFASVKLLVVATVISAPVFTDFDIF